VFDDVCMCRSSLLSGTSAFADDPWAAIEDRGNAVADDRSMSVDQIRQQQQQIIARLYFCFYTKNAKFFTRQHGLLGSADLHFHSSWVVD